MNPTPHQTTTEERPGCVNTSLLAALEMILTDHASGILTSARVDGDHRKLHVVAGEVVTAASLEPEGRLLARLRAAHQLSEAQHAEALVAIEASGQRSGSWAIDQARVPEEAVVTALTEQIRDALAALLADPHHPVRFLPIPELTVASTHPHLPITEAIPTALLSLPVATLRRAYPLDDDATFRPAVTPWRLAQQFVFDDAAATVLGLVERGRPLAEIARLAALTPDAVRQRLFLLAYLGLITPEQVPAATAAAPTPPAAETAATPTPPATPAAATETGAISEEARALERELTGLARRIGAMDPYALLRVNRNHSLTEVKRSYHHLSKRFHPDVVRGLGLGEEIIAVADHVTQALTAAYQTLSDPKHGGGGHGDHPAAHHPAPGDPEAIFTNAKLAITGHDYERAARLLANLIERKPDETDYHLYLAAACIRLRGRKREAEQALKRATRLAPSDPRGYVALGDLYREGGMEEKAAGCYREALRWDPHQRHAAQALAEMEAASHKPEGSRAGLSGLLGRLRKG